MNVGDRSGAIDAVRVLGITAVVAGHTLDPRLAPLFYTWHVPIFFVLVGYFWSSERTFLQEARNRARTLWRPYVTWLTLLAVPYVLVHWLDGGLSPGLVFGPVYGGRFAGPPFSTFWFVSVLFFSVLLLRALQALPKPVLTVALVAFVVLGSLFGFFLSRTPLAIGMALPCAALVAMGIVLKRWHPRIRKPMTVGLSLLLISAAAVISGISLPLDIKVGNLGTPVMSLAISVAISSGLILVADSSFRHLPSSVHRGVTLLAYAGFTVVLVHPAIVWILSGQVDRWVTFAAALIIPWGLGIACLRSPASTWLTGVRRRPSKMSVLVEK